MTSRFILNKFDFDFPASGLLVRLGLFLVVIVVAATVYGVVVVDEGVVGDGRAWLLLGMGVDGGGGVGRVCVHGPLALSHIRGGGGLR